MENVFALTTVEKRKGVERAKTTGHQSGLRKGVDAGWRLSAAHQTCSPDRMVFIRRETEEKDTVRM